MKLQGRNLSLPMDGEDVKLLHRELSQLGYTIPTQEVEKGLFEKGTHEAVLMFQQARNLGATGVVDEATAKAINDSFIVQGTVWQEKQKPLPDAIVRAFDKDLRQEQLLGKTSTNNEGFYKIPYSRVQFLRAEKRNAYLIVRAYHPNSPDLCLGESELIFKAKKVQEVNLSVDLTTLSEYEKYLATLDPVRENVPIAKLTKKDIAFLSGETGMPAQRIELLVTAASLGKQTELPPAAFYGFARMDLPTTLSDLLDQDTKILRKTLEAALKGNIIPGALQKDLDRILERLSELEKVDPGVQIKKQKVRLRQLGKVVALADAKMEAVIKKAGSPVLLNDKALTSLVKDGELEEHEAKELGLTVSLHGLFDENLKLAEAVKKGKFLQLPWAEVRNIEDLVAFDQADWVTLLKKTKTDPPKGLNQEGYAALLAKKVENLYPSKVMLARVTSKATDGVVQGLEDLNPLFEKNTIVVGAESFETLDVKGIDPKEVQKLRVSHTRLKGLANTYPGMGIDAILDDRKLSASDKEKQITARIGFLTRFHSQNPDKEFLFLDYSPDSADLQALDFAGFSADEQRMVLKTVKAYQRMYSVTQDGNHAKFFLEMGHHSPFSITKNSRRQFVASTDLPTTVAEVYYDRSRSSTTGPILAVAGAVDLVSGAHAHAHGSLVIDNTDPAITDYLKKIDGWEALFGSLDYCKCEHCRSIFSPAAYFVDLMRFVKIHILDEFFEDREDHVLHLNSRRPDLWKLPLTCDNTNQLIPYLDIINEVLENYIALSLGFDEDDLPGPGEDRSPVEILVYKELQDSIHIHSFRQPFSLPIERLAIYLAHFDVNRGDVARLLEASADDLAVAALKISQRQYELITRTNRDIVFIRNLYGIDFDDSGDEITFSDPDPDVKGSENDVQLLLKATELTRFELGELITLKFVLAGGFNVSGGAEIEIKSEKRDEEESVQNDIERIHGLTAATLDNMHRFTRLWRQTPWSIKELHLVLIDLAKEDLVDGIKKATLRYIVDILSIQKRFNVSVEELCALWSNLPKRPVVEGKASLFDRLFNLPDFVQLDGRFPRATPGFLHPAFRETPPDEVDYALHRLLAGLKVNDETLFVLINHLSGPSAIDLNRDNKFSLSRKNLALLYRHARLAEWLKLSIPQLFQLIHLAGTISVDHISRLDDLSALLVFYDWWQTTDYSLNDLEFITGGQVKKSEAYPDASGISRRLIQNIKVEQALTFSDTVFAFLEGVTEEQSQKVIAQNLGAFVETPGAGYRVSTSFGPNTPINIPRNISAKEKQIRHLLIPYHTPGRPAFVDRIFMAIAGVTEEQSRAIVEANLAAIDKACGIRYRVSESFDPKADPNMTINIPESISGTPKEISKIRAQIRDLLSTYFAPGAVFDDNLFTAIDNVTEEQSRANLAENPELIISVPMEHTYWLTAAFPGSSLTIPKGTPITKPNAKSLLSTYHALEVIPNHIAGELGIDVEKTKGLIGLAGIDLTESIFANALQEGDPDGVILNLIETLLPFNVLFKNEAFDSNALNFISNHPGLFSDIDFDDVAIENIRMLFIYQGFLAKGDGEKNREQLHDLLLAFNAGRFYPESDDGETKTEREDRRNIQTALAQTLDAESGLVITAHEEIKLPDTVLEALVKLERCIELSRHLGVGCEVLKLIVSNDYEKLNRAANAIITAFRTKYEDEEKWREKIEPFDDKIRSRKRDALTDYLIHSLDPKIFDTLNDLYHYFLIDVELEGCARTSRVVAANSSVQLYVHRILMNLEQDRAGEILLLMEEEAIAEWEWRKNYRVWEANRKIFLYPENYIEPDLRDNKTPLFKELESTLLQQEINEDTVLEAYASYMRGFDEVANLKIAGSYHNKVKNADFLHLFSVSDNDTPIYYYRAVENAYWGEKEPDKYGIVWHPWRKIDVQIPVKKVAPIIFKGRLYVFWVEITTRPENEVIEGSSNFVGYKHTMSLKFTSLRLDGTWTPPQKISLYEVPPFNDGDGVIDEPTLFQTSPKDGHTLFGFQWDQVYPDFIDFVHDNLVITGRNFKMNSIINFTKKVITPPVHVAMHDFRPFLPRLLSAKTEDNARRLYYRNPDQLPTPASYHTTYALASVLVDDIKVLVKNKSLALWRHGLTTFECNNGPIASLRPDDELAVINGSLGDIIIDSNEDLFLLQGSVRNDNKYLLKRLGTTLGGKLVTKLFAHGIEGLLDTEYQHTIEERSFPAGFSVEEYIEQFNKERHLDFTGTYGVYYREIFFHIPFLIANHLNSQQKFAAAQEWYHYIFNPTARASEKDSTPEDRNWRYLEFRNRGIDSLRDQLTDPTAIETYKRDPFNPHTIARLPLRFSAYQKSIVMKYIDNLLDWGDHLFAQDTMESINEATLLYVLASDILGERPAELGECGEVGPKTYKEIAPLLNEENEFLIEMWHVVQRKRSQSAGMTYDYAVDFSRLHSATTDAHDHITMCDYTTPSNIAIRAGAERAAESAPRDLAADWVGAAGDAEIFRGLDWSGEQNRANNIKRVSSFLEILAFEIGPVFCIPENENLKSYWDRVENRLFKIRNCMNIRGIRRELSLFAPEIDPMLLVRAKAAGLSIEDVLNSISGNLPPYRFSYLIERAKGYAAMLQGFGAALLSALEKKDIEDLNLLRTSHQQHILRLTRQLRQWEIDVASKACEALQKRKEAVEYRKGYYNTLITERLNAAEILQIEFRTLAATLRAVEAGFDISSAIQYLFPEIGSPFALKYGGKELGDSATGWARVFRSSAQIADEVAALAGLAAGFQRREEGWEHQKTIADHELNELVKQIKISEIRLDIANRSIEIHDKTTEQLDEVYEFYKDKFSNLGLYTWLSTNLQRLFREAYNNAYAMAKLAEQAYRFERGNDAAELIGPNHWEASKTGLLAGERLLIDLQNLERKFLETNYRSLEIDQAFSLTQINPAALIQLKETGSCQFEIPEIFFDLFYPGHYRRRIKAARLTIPCITGPYTNVSATLTLTGSKMRNEPKIGQEYMLDVPRSRSITIATSTAQNDAGVFELNFRDERYMPFEGAGAVSEWNLSLPKNFRQFDYQTINDVILHISYTAEEDGLLRESVEKLNADIEGTILDFLENKSLYRVFSFRQEFSNEFNRLLHSQAGDPVQIQITDKHFPIFLKGKDLNIKTAQLVLRTPDQSMGEFDISINGESQTGFDDHTTMDDLPANNLNVSDVFPEPKGILGEHTLVVNIPGNLAPDSLVPPDVSAIDSDKLTDIYLYLEYGII